MVRVEDLNVIGDGQLWHAYPPGSVRREYARSAQSVTRIVADRQPPEYGCVTLFAEYVKLL